MWEEIIICVFSSAVYFNSLRCGFVFDDVSAIRDNQDLRPHTSLTELFKNDFWGTPMNEERSHKSYRPFTVLTFRINFLFHELIPLGYHAVNVILHCVVVFLFFKLCLRYLKRESGFVSSILFSAHPIHTEAVTGVVGRAELLSSVFFLSALLLYTRVSDAPRPRFWVDLINLVMVGILICIGTFCKEQCVTVFGIFIACELYTIYQKFLSNGHEFSPGGFKKRNYQKPRTFKHIVSSVCRRVQFKLSLSSCFSYAPVYRILILLVFFICIMIKRIQIMGGQLPHFTEFDNPASHAPPLIRRLTHLYLVPVNLGLLIFPSNLCADWTLRSLELIHGWTDPRNILTLMAISFILSLVLTTLSWKAPFRQSRTVCMALSLLVFPFIPASNLFFPVGFVVAERVLYTPSLGFCLLIGLGFENLGIGCTQTKTINLKSLEVKKFCSLKHGLGSQIFSRISIGFVIISFVCKTIQRNTETNEYSLFTSALKVNPNNAKMWNNVGHSLEAEGKYLEALGYFRKAVNVQPNDMGARINVGRTYVNLGMPDKAEEAYYGALEYFPKPKKGQIYYARVSPKDLMVFINLANLYVNRSPPKLEDAATLLRRAISLRSDFVDAYQNYGSVLIKLGRYEEAEEAYRNALLYQPKNPDLNYNLGVVLLESHKKSEGLSYLNTALMYNSQHEPSLYENLLKQNFDPIKIHFALGMLETDKKNYVKASKHYQDAIFLDPDHKGSLFNLALLYRNHFGKLEDASNLARHLIKVHPSYVKPYLLLGDIELTEKSNIRQAKQYFVQALKLDPSNVQAKHNLCIALANENELEQSESCLLEAIAMESKPQNYLIHHLKIIRERLHSHGRRAYSKLNSGT
ncbi:Protein O-mannosyl-transferase TMTC3 [Schistosoma japonicum]|nr:Protein O-mannosyl-transferase TMTC3 [Schistosoma japonicum]